MATVSQVQLRTEPIQLPLLLLHLTCEGQPMPTAMPSPVPWHQTRSWAGTRGIRPRQMAQTAYRGRKR